MINYYDKHLFISKKKLAELAGVSERTFRRYLATRRHILDEMGISPKAQLLPPQAVKYICEDYCIDLPEQLQDQKVVNMSPIYQRFIRELQKATYFNGQWMPVTDIPHDFRFSFFTVGQRRTTPFGIVVPLPLYLRCNGE